MNAPVIALGNSQTAAQGQILGASCAEVDLGRPEPIGRKARRLFRDLRLYKTPKDTGLRLIYMPVLRPIALVAIGLYCLGRTGGPVRRQFGKSRLQQAREIASLAWQEGLSANAYYMLEFYRPDGNKRASQALARRETKHGLMGALNKLRPLMGGKRSSLGDKLFVHDRCSDHGIPTIPVLLTARGGAVEQLADLFTRGDDFFMKPRHGKGAKGASAVRRLGEDQYRMADGRILTQDGLLQDLARQSLKTPYLLQPRMRNHADIADLAAESLLVVRVFTCLDTDGNPVVTHAMLRVLAKLEPDWHDVTEYAAPIDLATGRMSAMTGDKLDGALAWYDHHPRTGSPVTGRVLATWPEIRRVSVAAHRVFADRLLLGWDIAVTQQGVLVVEGNALPDVTFLQRVHRKAIGDSPLGPLLRDHLRRLEERAASHRP